MSLFHPSLSTLIRQAEQVLAHRARELQAPVVVWQGPKEADAQFDARIATARARLPRQVTLIAACTPRPGLKIPGVTLVEFPAKMLSLLNPATPARYRIGYSGRGAAKSWSFARALILRCLQAPIRVLCAREYQGSIAESVLKLLDGQINELGLDPWFTVQRDSVTAFNSAEFIFAGLHHDVSKVKSTEDVSIAWVEEGERVSDDSLQVLIPTIRRMGSEVWITFNPDAERDPVYRRFVKSPPPGALVQFVSWRDNPWFPHVLDLERQHLERIDPDAAAHIWEGQCRAASDAQIFGGKYSIEGFEVPTLPEENATDEQKAQCATWDGPYFGADWGFAQDPTTLVKCWIHERRLYVEFEAYQVGVDTDRVPALFDAVPDSRRHVIRADNARPETISALSHNGFPKITAVEKWPGSVEDGIQHLRSYEQIIVHPRCTHTIEEMRLYSYRVDRLTGDIKAEPADKHNHIVDAIRYALAPVIATSRNRLGMFQFIEAEYAQLQAQRAKSEQPTAPETA